MVITLSASDIPQKLIPANTTVVALEGNLVGHRTALFVSLP
jgi:hypothetical protein